MTLKIGQNIAIDLKVAILKSLISLKIPCDTTIGNFRWKMQCTASKKGKKGLTMTVLILTTDCMVQYQTFLENESNIIWQLNICAFWYSIHKYLKTPKSA